MKDLLSKIFDKIAYYENDSIKMGKDFDCQVDFIFEPLKSTMDESQVEQVKELVYEAAYFAEKDGFLLGVRFVVRLLMETIGNAE